MANGFVPEGQLIVARHDACAGSLAAAGRRSKTLQSKIELESFNGTLGRTPFFPWSLTNPGQSAISRSEPTC